ncbi:uncharacterized protein LOC143461675 [Clavelina lepadiformis]|uniref:uncharacterized protein LOC143461675 n=1 Tax=Clavelina lepadiformis TaxID=159417 RepID=UPI0040436E29
MGNSESTCCEISKQEEDLSPSVDKGEHELVYSGDPRSPTAEICRTPISCLQENKEEPSLVSTVEVNNQACKDTTKTDHSESLLQTPKVVNDTVSNCIGSDILDPRSPSEGITRTPLRLPDKVNEERTLIDPRSPTVGIDRTPISAKEQPKSDNNTASAVSRDLHDPRSPTTELSRTPLKLSYKENLRRTVLLSNTLMSSPVAVVEKSKLFKVDLQDDVVDDSITHVTVGQTNDEVAQVQSPEDINFAAHLNLSSSSSSNISMSSVAVNCGSECPSINTTDFNEAEDCEIDLMDAVNLVENNEDSILAETAVIHNSVTCKDNVIACQDVNGTGHAFVVAAGSVSHQDASQKDAILLSTFSSETNENCQETAEEFLSTRPSITTDNSELPVQANINSEEDLVTEDRPGHLSNQKLSDTKNVNQLNLPLGECNPNAVQTLLTDNDKCKGIASPSDISQPDNSEIKLLKDENVLHRNNLKLKNSANKANQNEVPNTKLKKRSQIPSVIKGVPGHHKLLSAGSKTSLFLQIAADEQTNVLSAAIQGENQPLQKPKQKIHNNTQITKSFRSPLAVLGHSNSPEPKQGFGSGERRNLKENLRNTSKVPRYRGTLVTRSHSVSLALEENKCHRSLDVNSLSRHASLSGSGKEN